MSHPSTPQPSADARLASVSATQVALIALLAALLSGALALGASLGNAHIAAKSSASNVSTQLLGQSKELERQHRRDIYASFARAEEEMKNLEAEAFHNASNAGDVTKTGGTIRAPSDADMHRLRQQLDRMSSTGFTVGLFASGGVVSAYNELMSYHEDLVGLIEAVRFDPPTSPVAHQQAAKLYGRFERLIREQETRFV